MTVTRTPTPFRRRREYLRSPIGRSPVRDALGGLRASFLLSSRAGGGGAIPDSVVSRENDDSTTTGPQSIGVAISPNEDFSAIAFRISSNTSGFSRARLYDYSSNSYVKSKDVSGLTAGDTVRFDYTYIANNEYGFEIDDNGASYTQGYPSSYGYPYTGSELDIINRSIGGSQTTNNPNNVNDVGNPDGVLG